MYNCSTESPAYFPEAGYINSLELAELQDWQEPSSKFQAELAKIRLNASLAFEEFNNKAVAK